MKKLFLILLLALLCTITTWADNQAKIGNTEYATLTEALAASQDGDEVVLLADIENATNYTITKGITLDLNGYSIVQPEANASQRVLLIQASGKDVVLRNGTISRASKSFVNNSSTQYITYDVWCYQAKSVVLEDMTIQSAGTPALQASYGAGDVYVKGCEISSTYGNAVNVQNPSFVIDNSESRQTVITTADASVYAAQAIVTKIVKQTTTPPVVTLNNGTLIGRQYGVQLNGANTSFVMNGGTVNFEGMGVQLATANTVFTMNAGTLQSVPQKNVNYAVYGISAAVGSNKSNINIHGGEILVNKDGNDKEVRGITTNGYSSIAITMTGGSIKAEGGLIASGIVTLANTTLTMSGGAIEATTYGITGNGGSSTTTIAISGGTIKGGVVGIYHPQGGTLNISGNAYIEGASGVQLCSGYASAAATEVVNGEISGGTIVATGADQRASKTGDGIIPDGAAVSVVNRNYPGGTPKFQIVSGVFKSAQGQPLMAYTWQNNTASEWPTKDADGNDVDVRNFLSAIGGYFNGDVSTFLLEDYKSQPVTFDGTTYHMIIKDNVEEQTAFTDSSDEEAVRLTADVEVGNGTDTHTETADYVEVAQDKTLTIKDNATLEVGNGGLVLAEENAQLVIEEGGVVTVGTNGIISTSEDNIILNTSEESYATLLLDPNVVLNTTPKATYRFTSKAFRESATALVWQRFGMPVSNGVVTMSYANESDASSYMTYVYDWNYDANGGNGEWRQLGELSGNPSAFANMTVTPFACYEMLSNNDRNNPITYEFKGSLMGNTDAPMEFHRGWNCYANSYTAPINTAEFVESINSDYADQGISATIYLYFVDSQDPTRYTWEAVNIMNQDEEGYKEITPMRAFMMYLGANAASAAINYEKNVYNPAMGISNAAAPARQRKTFDRLTLKLNNANGQYCDRLTLAEGDNFSGAFDNGYDAQKYMNDNENLYAISDNEPWAMLASDNLDGLRIGFDTKQDGYYTISISNANAADYVIKDLTDGNVYSLTDGNSFTFFANAGSSARFVLAKGPKVATTIDNTLNSHKPYKRIENGQLLIIRDNVQYNAQGQTIR